MLFCDIQPFLAYNSPYETEVIGFNVAKTDIK
jgi:hypothetical protein